MNSLIYNRSKLNMVKAKGFSLIELMVAMVIGLIILLGLVSLFTSSSALNRAQSGLSVLQENGRYAISRLKRDIEMAGRKHCATVAMPSSLTTDWNQGYEMTSWTANNDVTFSNGFPNNSDVIMDSETDNDQLGDTALAGTDDFPIDPSYFIRGHECSASSCTPATTDLGSDLNAPLGGMGTADGDRPASSDILTMRYLTESGGQQVFGITPNAPTNPTSYQLDLDAPGVTGAGVNGIGLISDCFKNHVYNINGNTVNVSAMPSFDVNSDTRLFDLDQDLRTVSYYLKLDTDPNQAGRLISSLYRSENGVEQQMVEGVERFDVFYLAQTQTGHVVRMTADAINAVQGGGDGDNNGTVDGIDGCIIPPRTNLNTFTGQDISNDQGCLWRSVYAIEIHMLLNTVDNSSTVDDDRYIYSPDGLTPQNPTAGLPSGLDAGRMYRREFSAIVPVRSYTL